MSTADSTGRNRLWRAGSPRVRPSKISRTRPTGSFLPLQPWPSPEFASGRGSPPVTVIPGHGQPRPVPDTGAHAGKACCCRRRSPAWRPVGSAPGRCPILGAKGERRPSVRCAQTRVQEADRESVTCADARELIFCTSARPVRDEEAAGSNPATPTTKSQVNRATRSHAGADIAHIVRFWERACPILGCPILGSKTDGHR
jgi:hypothetical protein